MNTEKSQSYDTIETVFWCLHAMLNQIVPNVEVYALFGWKFIGHTNKSRWCFVTVNITQGQVHNLSDSTSQNQRLNCPSRLSDLSPIEHLLDRLKVRQIDDVKLFKCKVFLSSCTSEDTRCFYALRWNKLFHCSSIFFTTVNNLIVMHVSILRWRCFVPLHTSINTT